MVQFNGRWLPPQDPAEGDDPEKDFPIRDTYTDCAGQKRHFVISPFPVSLGFALQAEEEGNDRHGFFFREFDATSPYLALGRLRGRIRKALSTRHIEQPQPGNFQMTHGTVRGRITYGSGEVAFVIDGHFLTLPQFGKMLETNEGFEFSINISD